MALKPWYNAIIWCVPEAAAGLQDEARKVLAWEAIEEEEDELKLDEVQKRQLAENLKKAHRDLRESVWRTYKNIALLGKDNTIRVVDLGLVHSSAADSLVTLILNRQRQDGDLEEGISPNYLTRNWPPAIQGMEHQVGARCLLRVAAVPAPAQRRCGARHDRQGRQQRPARLRGQGQEGL